MNRENKFSSSNAGDMYFYLSTAILGLGMILYPFVKGARLFNVIDLNTVMIMMGILHAGRAIMLFIDDKQQNDTYMDLEEDEEEPSERHTYIREQTDDQFVIHIMDNKCAKQPLKVDIYELTPINPKVEATKEKMKINGSYLESIKH